MRVVDEDRIIAWLDGTLSPGEAAEVAAAVTADPALAELAERHRQRQARPRKIPPPARPANVIVSLAAVRSERTRPKAARRRRWILPCTVGAALLAGLASGYALTPKYLADRSDALLLSPSMAQALDSQLSGQPGTLGIALSFRDQDGAYCRSFLAQHLGGVACKTDGRWLLRYAVPGDHSPVGYRREGADAANARAIASMIAGAPLGAAAERAARDARWR